MECSSQEYESNSSNKRLKLDSSQNKNSSEYEVNGEEEEDNFELVFEDEDDYYMEDESLCLPDPGSDLPSPAPLEESSPEAIQNFDINKYIYNPSSSQEPSQSQIKIENSPGHEPDVDFSGDEEDFNDIIWDEVVDETVNNNLVKDEIDQNIVETSLNSRIYDTQLPGLNTESITITMDEPKEEKKSRIGLSKVERDLIINLHRSSFLGWIAVGKYWHNLIKNKALQAQLMSLLPLNFFKYAQLRQGQSLLPNLTQLLKWWKMKFNFKKHNCIFCNNKKCSSFELDEPILEGCSNLMTIQFVSLLKALGFRVRLILGVQLINSYLYFMSLADTPGQYNELSYNAIWIEVLDPFTDMWTVIQPSSNFAAPGSARPDRLSQLIPKHPHPTKVMTYVFAFDQSVSEITPRYVPNFLSVATLARSRLLSNQFLSEIFEDVEPTTTWEFKERQQMEQYQVMEKMPQSLAGFRNHPLYTLPQLLHKNQCILPSAKPIGLFKGSPVYDTNSVLNLKSEMNWYLLGRVIKEGESALKLNLFAEYQTKLYEPPTIEDGKLPRNKHGNWDLYQPHMLPQNTVHINLPNALTFLKASDYEYVEAVTGFIFNKQGAIPQVNGAIVHSVDAQEIIEYCEAELERKEKEERFKEKKEAYLLWIDIIKFVKNRDKIMKQFGVE